MFLIHPRCSCLQRCILNFSIFLVLSLSCHYLWDIEHITFIHISFSFLPTAPLPPRNISWRLPAAAFNLKPTVGRTTLVWRKRSFVRCLRKWTNVFMSWQLFDLCNIYGYVRKPDSLAYIFPRQFYRGFPNKYCFYASTHFSWKCVSS